MSKQEKDPSEIISDFLNYIDQVRCDYKAAHDAVKREEKRLQDLLYELVIQFFDEPAHKSTVNKMLQLLGSRESRRSFWTGKDIIIHG